MRRTSILIAAVVVLGAVAAAATVYIRHERARVIPVPILMYHNVDNVQDNVWCVLPEDFEKHMQYLSDSGYRTILPSDLVAHARWGKPLPPKPVIITFDDGFLNGLTNAEPILKRHGFQAVAYIVTSWTGPSPEDRRFHGERRDQPCITWPEIRAMRKRGTILFGGQSVSHKNLAAMRDASIEILPCYRDIARFGHFRPEGFCYPFGQRRPETINKVKFSRFTTALAGDDRVAHTGPDMNLYNLPRVSVCGGKQNYEVLSVTTNEATRELVIQIRNDGLKTPVWPRLKLAGTNDNEGWLPAGDVGRTPREWRWPIAPDSTDGKQRRLELWDCNKILLLYARDI